MWVERSHDKAVGVRTFLNHEADSGVYYAPRKPEWADIAALAGDDEIGGWSARD